jgi:hypothetical protein
MKIYFLKATLIVGILALILSGCNRSTKTKAAKGTTSDGKEASVEVEIFDFMKVKDQIVEIIENTPKPEEITTLINKAGASYILDLTVPASNIDKYMTQMDLSLAMGLYGFDMMYAKTYNRSDMVSKLIVLENQIIEKLGIQDGHTSYKDYGERINANIDNKDSLDFLITEMMNKSYQKFAECEHTNIYAISFIGANIEGLYILSQLALLANDNSDLLKILSKQHERAESVYSILELMSTDPNVKPYYEDMLPIFKFYKENKTIGEEELNIIAPLIENIHNKML